MLLAIGAPFFLCPHARGGAQRGGYSRQYGDGYVQNFLPNCFCFHDCSVDG